MSTERFTSFDLVKVMSLHSAEDLAFFNIMAAIVRYIEITAANCAKYVRTSWIRLHNTYSLT